MKIEDSFWPAVNGATSEPSPDAYTTGVKALASKLVQGSVECAQLISFFEERADIEDYYSRRLERLSLTMTDGEQARSATGLTLNATENAAINHAKRVAIGESEKPAASPSTATATATASTATVTSELNDGVNFLRTAFNRVRKETGSLLNPQLQPQQPQQPQPHLHLHPHTGKGAQASPSLRTTLASSRLDRSSADSLSSAVSDTLNKHGIPAPVGFGFDDGATLKAAYLGLLRETRSMASLHRKLCTNIRQDVLGTIKEYSALHNEKLANGLDKMFEVINGYQATCEEVKLARQRYINACNVADKAKKVFEQATAQKIERERQHEQALEETAGTLPPPPSEIDTSTSASASASEPTSDGNSDDTAKSDSGIVANQSQSQSQPASQPASQPSSASSAPSSSAPIDATVTLGPLVMKDSQLTGLLARLYEVTPRSEIKITGLSIPDVMLGSDIRTAILTSLPASSLAPSLNHGSRSTHGHVVSSPDVAAAVARTRIADMNRGADEVGEALVRNGYLRSFSVGRPFNPSSSSRYLWRKEALQRIALVINLNVDQIDAPFITRTSDLERKRSEQSDTGSTYHAKKSLAPGGILDVSKADSDHIMARQNADLVDSEYRTVVQRADQHRFTLESSLRDFYSSIDTWELSRIAMAQHSIHRFTDVHSDLVPELIASTEDRLRLYANSVKPAQDVEFICESYGTCTYKPHSVIYRNMYHPPAHDQVFGVSLDAQLAVSHRPVPLMICKILSSVRKRTVKWDGLADKRAIWLAQVGPTVVSELRRELNSEPRVTLKRLRRYDLGTIISALHQYLLELPVGLITADLLVQITKLYTSVTADKDDANDKNNDKDKDNDASDDEDYKLHQLSSLISSLPTVNRLVLEQLLTFVGELIPDLVKSHSSAPASTATEPTSSSSNSNSSSAEEESTQPSSEQAPAVDTTAATPTSPTADTTEATSASAPSTGGGGSDETTTEEADAAAELKEQRAFLAQFTELWSPVIVRHSIERPLSVRASTIRAYILSDLIQHPEVLSGRPLPATSPAAQQSAATATEQVTTTTTTTRVSISSETTPITVNSENDDGDSDDDVAGEGDVDDFFRD
ncbi:hypothetical protein GQ42DRAFT_25915 [Ramicandelaber brevisporus]|nr:hypothetical protein GQ42DRAFT_25915 [Ramicandelaber brevisporus]